jgi:prepilin-type N-terminal cleavage/methylation domain-containing protein
MRRKATGFTLIELLVVVAIIGIITAIAIPNLLNAIDRGKQKRSMVDLRSIGTAVESYAVEYNTYPVVSDIGALASSVNSTRTGFTIASGGKDGGGLSGVEWGPFQGFEKPIVLIGGQFAAWPEGAQQ